MNCIWRGVPFFTVFFFRSTLTENSKQIFLEKELRGLSHNFHIHVSVSDLYTSTIGLHILLQENMYINRSQTHECGNWD
jgi:hypothetical protein